MCDRHGRRWKIKSPRTLACTVFAAKAITSTTPKIICLSSSPGEDAELLTYFPEITATYHQYKRK